MFLKITIPNDVNMLNSLEVAETKSSANVKIAFC